MKRLPFSITSTWSEGSPRSEGARTKVEASEIVFWPTKNDGTRFLTVSSMLAVGCAVMSLAEMISIGEAESVVERSTRRVPVTMTSPKSAVSAVPPAVAPVVCAGAVLAAKARIAEVAIIS